MIEYIIGKIIEVKKDRIILENSGIGYNIITTTFFDINTEYKVFIYHHKTELIDELYGFKDEESKKLFLELIKIKGIGCRIAINILSNDSKEIILALKNKDYNYFTKIPKIGMKVAIQIVDNIKINSEKNELVEALEVIGYHAKDIYKIVPNIDQTKDIETQIKEALSLLLERS